MRNILHQSREKGLPEPLVQEIGMRLRFTVFLAEPQVLDKQQAGSRSGSAARSDSGAQSGAQSRAVLLALSDTPLSAAELMHLLGLETKTGAFKRKVKELLQQALIEYTLPDKPTSRLQKYRLSEDGKAYLASTGDIHL